MRIAYSNLVDDATLTASSEDLRFPVENTQDQRLAKPWRTQTVTGITCVVDLGAAAAVDVVAIVGHTISTSATINIEANASDSWGGPSFSTSLTALENMILKYFTAAQTYRYWRFTVEDASNSSSYVDIGRLWLGEYLALDPAATTDFTVSKLRNDNVTYGQGRQKFATPGVGWRRFDLSFRRHAGTMLTAIQTMYDTVGNHTSLIFSNFDTRRDYEIVEPVYCSIVGSLDFKHDSRMYFNYGLTLEEDK